MYCIDRIDSFSTRISHSAVYSVPDLSVSIPSRPSPSITSRHHHLCYWRLFQHSSPSFTSFLPSQPTCHLSLTCLHSAYAPLDKLFVRVSFWVAHLPPSFTHLWLDISVTHVRLFFACLFICYLLFYLFCYQLLSKVLISSWSVLLCKHVYFEHW